MHSVRTSYDVTAALSVLAQTNCVPRGMPGIEVLRISVTTH